MIRENGGWEMFKMIEVEKYPCNDKREAEKKETEVMKELKSNMNMIKSYLTEEEKNDYKKKANIKYYGGHKTTISKKGKTYRQNNIQERKKNYYDTNKVKILDKQRLKVKCDCGCEVSTQHIQRHKTTKKHLNLIQNPLINFINK